MTAGVAVQQASGSQGSSGLPNSGGGSGSGAGDKVNGDNSVEVERGMSRAPKEGKPGTIYEQVDNNGNVMFRTVYGENGKPAYRDDITGRPHYHKSTGRYLDQHRHSYEYNEKGQRVSETILPILKGGN